MQSPKSFIFVVLFALAPALFAQDAKPLRVLRYRNSVTHAHGFTTDAAAPPAGFVGEDVSDSLTHSPLFYLSTEPYASTVPVYRFVARNGMMVFAANTTERQMLRASGLEESGQPVYVYDHQVEGASEVFRLTNPANGDVVYTASSEEKDYYVSQGWSQLSSLGFAQSTSSSSTGILRDGTVKLAAGELALVARTFNRGEKILFSGTNQTIQAFQPGTMLYSEKNAVFPMGLLAKVTVVSVNASGEIEVDTAPALVYEAFLESHVYVDNKPILFLTPESSAELQGWRNSPGLGPQVHAAGSAPGNEEALAVVATDRSTPEYLSAGTVKAATTSANWSNTYNVASVIPNTTLYKVTSGPYTGTLSASGSLKSAATLSVTQSGSQLACPTPSVTYSVALAESGSLTVTATGEVSANDDDDPLHIWGTQLGSVLTPLGIPISAEFDLYAGYNATATITATLTASEDATLTVGVQNNLNTNTWSPITQFSTANPTLTGTLSATGSAVVYLKPQLYVYAGAFGTGAGPFFYTKLQLATEPAGQGDQLHFQVIPGGSTKAWS